MQTASVSPHLAEYSLKGLSTLTDWLGLSVPTIVEIDQLRSLPKDTFGRAWADALNT